MNRIKAEFRIHNVTLDDCERSGAQQTKNTQHKTSPLR